MGSVAMTTDPLQVTFHDLEKQASLMTSCTLLWKELSHHFETLEQDIQKKSQALQEKFETLDHKTKQTLDFLNKREVTIDENVDNALIKVEERKEAALIAFEKTLDFPDEDLLLKLRSFCTKMDSEGFWKFIIAKRKDIDLLREHVPLAISDCIDPSNFVLDAISWIFPVDKRVGKSEQAHDLGWACVLILESLVPVVADPVLGFSRPLVTPRVKEQAKEIASAWKMSVDERGGVENVKSLDVHMFLQHLVTFGIVSMEDADLYRKLVVGFAWRKQMPKLAISLGLVDKMADIIEELISKGQQVDAVHFIYEAGLVDKFPPVPLLKSYLKDSKKAASSILEDRNNSGQAVHSAGRKEQSALRAVIKCIEEYKLEAEYPPEILRKRLEQLDKVKAEKKKPATVPANKRTRASNGAPMRPAKAGRLTNAYVSSFPAGPTFVRSPSGHAQYQAGIPPYAYDRSAAPTMYGSRSPPALRDPYAYPPEQVAPPALPTSYPGAPMTYPAYGNYGNGLAPGYQQAYYR
ncbi:FRIGIDA-like protein 4b [Tasmannia lanceolata]|uniref:FRIGIDA-like protein 4b n=1 Tax=Tasmannia lanceolata TaxID=3420 RepID=UPI0040630DCD